MISAATTHRDVRKRRVLAGILLAWLGLLVQPCVADMAAMPNAGVEHCDHSGMPDHAAACHAVQAVDCETSAEANTASGGFAVLARAPATLSFLFSPSDGAADTADPRAVGTGPPLIIRFCSLRN